MAAPWRRTEAACGRIREALGKRLDGVNAGGVDGRHVAQPQNHHRLEGFDIDVASTSFSVVPKRNGP